MSSRSLRFSLVVPVIGLFAPGLATAQQNLQQVVAGLEWRSIGPATMGGRVADIAVDPTNASVIYVGTATGGVWKTTNHASSWTPIFDAQRTSSIGDVTIAPSNPNVVWVGTGEPQNRQSSPWGAGVFKSLDGGHTWEHMGLTETHHVGRIVIDPTNPDVVFVAAVGHLWGPNAERGVYKTADGGKTWRKVLFVDENTGAIDLAMDPGDPQTVFAAMYQRRRTQWGFSGGGPGSGIYRTLDGGATWERLTNGLPDGPMGRIGLSVYHKDVSLVYASIEADPSGGGGFGGFGGGTSNEMGKGGIFRSTDRGAHWEQLSDWNPRPMYFSQIRIDPNDPSKLFLGGVNLSISRDGGRNWDRNAAPAVHSDHHALWIDPDNSNHVLMGSDGGVSVSFDGGTSWRMYDNLPIGQFYEIGMDMRDPYYVCGGLQDNGSWCGPSQTYTTDGIRNSDWYNIWGGDGFYARIDPDDPTIVFGESQNGNFGRLDLTTMESVRLRPNPPGAGNQSPSYRWNWNTPFAISTHDPTTLYAGADVLLKSSDRGMSWKEISPDLTEAIDRDTLPIMGVKPSTQTLSRNDGISSYGTITTISESPLNAELLYVGTDDGNLQMTRDGGATWVDLTSRIRGAPPSTYVSRVVASGHAEGTVYATLDGHFNDDYKPYVFVSTDYGRSWQAIVNGLPDWSVNVVYEDSRNPNVLFVGNEVGVYFTVDRGRQWVRLNNNLPTVPVDDIRMHPREHDLVLGTHGRSIWILDDATPLEHLTGDVLASAAFVFPVRPAEIVNMDSPQGWLPGAFEAPNPPQGARIRYYLKNAIDPQTVARGSDGTNRHAASATVRLVITDQAGQTVRTLDGPANAGIHEVMWDLRLEPPYEPEQQQGGFGFFGGGVRGPRVLPGTYHVALSAGGATSTADIIVAGDHRIQIARADLEARQQVLLKAYRLAKPVYEGGQAAQRLTAQLADIQKLLREHAATPDTLKKEATALGRDVARVNRDLNQARQRSTRTAFTLEGWTAAPTDDAVHTVDEAWDTATAALRDLNTLITERIPAFYRKLDANAVRPDPGKPVEVPS